MTDCAYSSKADSPSDLEVTQEVMRWASLLSGMDPTSTANLNTAERLVMAWWVNLEASGLSDRLAHLPESFVTVQFGERIKCFEAWLELLKHVFSRLQNSEISFVDAIGQVAREFNQEEDRFKEWKQTTDSLGALIRWLPGFEHARNYLFSAAPTPLEALETTRDCLLESMVSPQSFLESDVRVEFDRNFLQFKQEYIEYYYAAHEAALHIILNEEMDSKVDYVSLRNLEMLSRLHYTNKSYINRVRIIGKWVQDRQCKFPVREILDRYSRCYCNFNPAGSHRVAESVTQMNTIIQAGIKYFRTILRQCKLIIIQDLKLLRADDYHSRQIAALLSRGPMIPLKSQSVTILNEIIQKHAPDFMTQMRAYRH